ncbi:MAG: hypothetical protein DMD82_13110 [Candidatus Rokuibacteriota bacterium]|nr:MAG: hypothetical protein DMD82_13110 [Candidatus Rokubacteria bacterium]
MTGLRDRRPGRTTRNDPVNRRATSLSLFALLIAALAWAADVVVVEDWSTIPIGSRGIPQGWRGQDWGNPVYDMAVVENGGHRVLHLKSRDESSTISKDIKQRVDLSETPILEWRWKATSSGRGSLSRCDRASLATSGTRPRRSARS